MMPFQQPWRDYRAGDLFYGVAAPNKGRNVVIETLAVNGKLRANDVVTIDRYDILADARGSSVNGNPLRHDPDFISSLQANPKYKDVVGTDLTDATVWMADPTKTTAIAKRKCKGGLDYITRHTQYHIHFCLQDLDLVQAASKSYDGKKGGSPDAPKGQRDGVQSMHKMRSITGAELRWVYRNRRDPLVMSKIQFWNGFPMPYRCPPPWSDPSQPDEVRGAWSCYFPTNEVW
jgi:hypothetical protein